jgi:hypothetical protein
MFPDFGDTYQYPNLPDANVAPALSDALTLSTISIAGEGSSAATLSIAPDLAVPFSSEYQVNEAVSEVGYVTTHAKFSNRRRAFDLTWTLSNADAATLRAFYLARTGPLTAWTFSAPHWGSIKVVFVPGTYQETVLSIGAKRATAKVLEVF